MKIKFSMKSVILILISLVLISSVVFTFIIKSDYSFELKFDDKDLDFFNEETLYFNESVDISFEGSGYVLKLDGNRFNNSTTIDSEGTYSLEIYKLLKHFSVTIVLESNPDIYLVDNDGNIIHNYLSNSSPFKVVASSEDISVYINNMTYVGGPLVEEAGNYTVSTDDDIYIVNILDINK